MTIEEISLKNPNGTGATAAIDIPGITDVTVRNITPGPDGYTFTNSYHGYHTNLMTEIFSGSYDYSDRYSMALFKNGRYVPVNVPDNNPYNNYNTQFIGWIIE
jgi:hypothetical protein